MSKIPIFSNCPRLISNPTVQLPNLDTTGPPSTSFPSRGLLERSRRSIYGYDGDLAMYGGKPSNPLHALMWMATTWLVAPLPKQMGCPEVPVENAMSPGLSNIWDLHQSPHIVCQNVLQLSTGIRCASTCKQEVECRTELYCVRKYSFKCYVGLSLPHPL